jgi:WD40 repeat protein
MRLHFRVAVLLSASALLLSLGAQDKPAAVVFKGHTEAIYSVGFNKDGTLAVTGAFDKTVRLWDPKTGKQLREFSGPSGHQSLVLSVTFNPAGDQIASGGSDNFVRVWDVPLSTPIRELAHTAGVTAVAATADGKFIAGAARDGSVKLWAADGKVIATLPGHASGATSAAFNANGQVLATTGVDGTVRFWNTADGKPAGAIGAHGSAVTGVAFSPSGNQAYTIGEDGLLKFWQIPVPPVKPLPTHADAITTLSMSADGNSVLTGGADKSVKLSAVGTGQLTREFTGATAAVTSAAFLPNGAIAVGTADGRVIAWAADGKPTTTLITHSGAVIGIGLSGNTLVTTGADGVLRSWAYPIGASRKIAHPDRVLGVAPTPDGKRLVTFGADKAIRIWSIADGTATGKIDLSFVPASVGISKNGAKLVAGGEKTVALFNLADSKPAGTISLPANVRGVALSADGSRVAVAGVDNRVRLYGPDLKPMGEFPHPGPVTAVEFHPDGNRILSVSDEKRLHIWDAKTVKELKAIPASDGPLVGLSMTADGSKIATAGADKTPTVWTLADGKASITLPLAGPAQEVAISPNGSRLAVAFTEEKANHLRVYDGMTGRELQALPDPAAPVRSLSFLADNRTLVSGGDDKAVTIHDVAVTVAVPVHTGGVVGLALNPAVPQAITAGADKTIKLWDLTTGKELKTIANLPQPITSLSASRDFTALAVTAGKVAKVLQIADDKELVSIAHAAEVVSVGLNNDKTRLITGSVDNMARVWEIATGRLLQTFAHTGPVRGVGFHPGLPLVVTASADKTAAVHPLVFTRAAAFPKPLRAIVATPDSARVVVAGDDGVVHVVNAGNATEERKIEGAAGPVYALALSKNGQVLATAGADKTIRLFAFNDGKEIGTIPATAPIRGLSLTADAKLLVGVADDKTVTVWSVSFQPGQPLPDDFGKVVQQFTQAASATSAAFTDKGELFTGSADKAVRQWKVAANVPTRNFQHPNLVDAVAWSPDGKLLATACHDGILRVFDVEKNAAVKAINAHTTPAPPSAVYSVTWTTDGKQLLSTSFDKSMKLWDATGGNLVREFKPFAEKTFEKGHTDQVFCAAITRDGKLIASGGSDRRIKIWSADGSVVREFPNPDIKGEPGQSHPGGIYQLRFTPDEKYLVSAGPAPRNQGYVAIWSVADGKLSSGQFVSQGPVFGLALTPDFKQMLLGCGPRVRQVQEAEAVLMPLPVK